MDWETVLQALANGVLIAGLYAVVAVGLTLVLGVMGIVNFAHGELVMLGAYVAFWLFSLCDVDPFISVLPAAFGLFILGGFVYRFTVRPILKAPPINQLLLTLGLSIFLQNLALILWGADFRSVSPPYSGVSLSVSSVSVGLTRVGTFLISALLTAALVLFLARARAGKDMRAVSQNNEGAWLIGINVDRTYLLAFATSAALAGASGALLSTIMYTMPSVGLRLALKSFCIVVIGGLGNVGGALVGALILGLAESLVGTYVPQGSGWAEGISFILIMAVLIVKPTGLGGVRRE